MTDRFLVILWLRGRGRVVEEVNATTAADARGAGAAVGGRRGGEFDRLPRADL